MDVGDCGLLMCFVSLSRVANQLLEDILSTEEEHAEQQRAKRRAGNTCRLRSTAESRRLRSTAAAQS